MPSTCSEHIGKERPRSCLDVLRDPSSLFILVGLCGSDDLLFDFYMYLRALEISKDSLS